ncbi:MAG: hypothetical protein Q9218_004767 [Villophora microphyllina]
MTSSYNPQPPAPGHPTLQIDNHEDDFARHGHTSACDPRDGETGQHIYAHGGWDEEREKEVIRDKSGISSIKPDSSLSTVSCISRKALHVSLIARLFELPPQSTPPLPSLLGSSLLHPVSLPIYHPQPHLSLI